MTWRAGPIPDLPTVLEDIAYAPVATAAASAPTVGEQAAGAGEFVEQALTS